MYNFVEFLTFTVVDFMDVLPFATFNTFFRDVFPTPFSFSGILAILSIYKQMVQGDIKSFSFNLPLTPHHRNRGALNSQRPKNPRAPPNDAENLVCEKEGEGFGKTGTFYPTV